MMLQNPATKYSAFPPVDLKDRQWPGRVIERAPIWMSTDLRDGNQALFEPMNIERKMRMFKRLCAIGVKEIEAAFPSASQTDFDFVRKLIEEGHIPDDVTIEVLAPAREALIRRTFESLKGARRAIVHIYNATSKPFREIVFGMQKHEVIELAVSAVRLVRQLSEENPETEWVLEYSPETFTATELDFALEICNAVTETWGATPERKVILNLPTTVEMATPNIYADQIEWMHRHLARRDSILISLHPHNDRGTAVAAAELGLMAGADRVEGCLFGNGERTGNVDLVTLALNLYTQGVSPNLDFSDINAVARDYEHCTQLPIHPRHPYVGDLVFTAFSGSHQDAIKKGFARQRPEAQWNLPYLPVDPADLGRSYESVIRINSQSGKGGVGYLMEQKYGLEMPKKMREDFSYCVKGVSDHKHKELLPDEIYQIFQDEYVNVESPIKLIDFLLKKEPDGIRSGEVNLEIDGKEVTYKARGNGRLDAVSNALQKNLGVSYSNLTYSEHALEIGSTSRAMAYIGITGEGGRITWGAGMDTDIITASIMALVSAINRMKAGK